MLIQNSIFEYSLHFFCNPIIKYWPMWSLKKRLSGARCFVWINMLITSIKLFYKLCLCGCLMFDEIPKIKTNDMLIKYVQQQ